MIAFTEKSAYKGRGRVTGWILSAIMRNPLLVLIFFLIFASFTYTYLGILLPVVIVGIQGILMAFSSDLLLYVGEFEITGDNGRLVLVKLRSTQRKLKEWSSILRLKSKEVKEEMLRYMKVNGRLDAEEALGILRKSGIDVDEEEVKVEIYDVHGIVKDLSNRFGLPTPRIAILKMGVPNAAATGLVARRSTIAATIGLFSSLDLEEVRAVLAHEYSHIKNGDTIALFSIISLEYLVRTAVIFNVHWVYGLIYTIVSVTLMFYLVKFLEIRADLTAAQILGDPEPLRRALQTIGRGRIGSGSRVRRALGWFKWFDTHPPLSYRIERLGRGVGRGDTEFGKIFLDGLRDLLGPRP